MGTQQLYDARDGFDSEKPDLLYQASVYIALKLGGSRSPQESYTLSVALSEAAGKVFEAIPWRDTLLPPRDAREGQSIKFSVLKEDAATLLQMSTKLRRGQMLAFENWAEAFGRELLLSENEPLGVISSVRVEVSFKRIFGTYTRAH